MIGMEKKNKNSIKASLTLPLQTLKLHLWMETQVPVSEGESRRKHKRRFELAIESWEQSTAFPAAGLVYAAEK